MKLGIYNKIKYISNTIPINLYARLTGQQRILPFYHAVSNNPKPHLKHLGYYRTKDNFECDLDFFLKYYNNIPIEEIGNTNSMAFHISFDDGLSEVYNEAIPILLEKKVNASLFINTDFIDNQRLFYRHKISLLIDDIKSSNVSLEKTAGLLSCNNGDVINKIDKLTDENIIDDIANNLRIDFEEYLNNTKPYLTTKQLVEIKKMGFTIGNHSKSHINFKNIPLEEQKNQISAVNDFLRDKLKVKNVYFSFPFGDERIKNDFFEYLYNDAKTLYSFGISGMKYDGFARHLHRIPMEYTGFSAEEIIKFEYFYFMLKAFINKNKIRR